MAWFDPPLYKPGNLRCPECGKHQGWYRAFGPWVWEGYHHDWKCAGCQTSLKYDLGRRLAIVIPMIPLSVLMAVLWPRPHEELSMILLSWILLGACWSTSIRRLEA